MARKSSQVEFLPSLDSLTSLTSLADFIFRVVAQWTERLSMKQKAESSSSSDRLLSLASQFCPLCSALLRSPFVLCLL